MFDSLKFCQEFQKTVLELIIYSRSEKMLVSLKTVHDLKKTVPSLEKKCSWLKIVLKYRKYSQL